MRMKLDENLPQSLKLPLASLGHDVCSTADEGLLGQSDEAVAAAAKSESRIVVTLDVRFADIRRHPPGDHPGIILLRPRTRGRNVATQFALRFFAQTAAMDFGGCIVVVDPTRARVRRPGSAK